MATIATAEIRAKIERELKESIDSRLVSSIKIVEPKAGGLLSISVEILFDPEIHVEIGKHIS